MVENDDERRKRQNEEREDELRRIPLQEIDKAKWPRGVREIAMHETGGLGIDKDGRLYWNGTPVEIVSQRLDLTAWQNIIGGAVALFTLITALATSVQAWTAYHDWACKVHWPVATKCPAEPGFGVNDSIQRKSER